MSAQRFFLAGILGLCLQAPVSFAQDRCIAEVRLMSGTPRLYVNGQPEIPMAYKTLGKRPGTNYWNSCLQTIALARDAGLHIYQVDIGLSTLGLPTNLLRGKSTSYDDSVINDIINADSNAFLIVSIDLTPDPYYRQHNQISVTNQYPATTDYSQMIWDYNITTNGLQPHDRQSPLSEKVWQDVEPCVSNIISHLEGKYGDRIIMYWPSFSDIGEWYYALWNGALVPGFGPCTTAGFQTWVSNKYSTVNALNTAWKSNYTNFSDITVPSWNNRVSRRAVSGDFFDPDADRYTVDFFDFFNGTMNYGAERIAKYIKNVAGTNKLVGMFWQYLHPLARTSLDKAGMNHSGHLKLMELLNCRDIDVLGTPIYPDVDHWMMPFHGTVDTIQEHGKLFWHEDDMETHLSSAPDKSSGIDETLQVYAYDFQEWMARQCGFWFFDIPAYGETASILNDPNIWSYVAERKRYWDEHCMSTNGAGFSPEIAVIRDESSARYMVSRNPVLCAVYSADKTNTLTQMIEHLVQVRDAPVGWYMLDDFISGKVPPAKIYIFADTFAVTDDQAVGITNRLSQLPGSVAVWFYAPGFVDPQPSSGQTGFSEQYISRLTGGILPQRFLTSVRDWNQPVTNSLSPDTTEFGSGITNLYPQFYIPAGQPGVEPLCVYKDSPGRIAAAWLPASAVRPWNSVYLCSPAISPGLLTAITTLAGTSKADGFNDTNLTQWIEGSGDWSVKQGELQQTGSSSNTAWINFAGDSATNFIMKADIHIPDSGWAGLQFRKSQPADSPYQSGYLVHVRNGGTVTLYKPGGALASVPSGGDASNGFVRLKVEAAGSCIAVYANDVLVLQTSDTTYTNGYFGLSTSASTGSAFDNINLLEASSDMDSDGLPNDWELRYFGDMTRAESEADPDKDGFSNLAEYIAGTDPTNPASRFAIVNTGFSPSGFFLNWNSVSGRVYSVSRSTNLLNGFSAPVQTNLIFPRNSFTDDVNAGDRSLFYKIDVHLIDGQYH